MKVTPPRASTRNPDHIAHEFELSRVGHRRCEETPECESPTARRRAGMEMLAAGHCVKQVAEAIAVDSRTVRRWKQRDSAERRMHPGLPVAGRPRLTATQLARLFVDFGVKRPVHVGLPGRSWTTTGFRSLSRREFPDAAEGYMCDQTLRKFLKANGCVWMNSCWVRVDR